MRDWPVTTIEGDNDCLILGGFQVFDDVVTIPLSPLTLMFGPNSAGKSAVQDGLRAFNALIEANRERVVDFYSPYGEDFFQPLQEFWRRTSGSAAAFSEFLTIGVRHKVDDHCRLRAALMTLVGQKSRADSTALMTIELVFRYRYFPEEKDMGYSARCEQDIFVAVGGEPLFQGVMGEHVAINLDHPLLQDVFPEKCRDVLSKSSFPTNFGDDAFKQRHARDGFDALAAIGGPLKAAWVTNGWLHVRIDPIIAMGKLSRGEMSLGFLQSEGKEPSPDARFSETVVSGGVQANEGVFAGALHEFLDFADAILASCFTPTPNGGLLVTPSVNLRHHIVSVPASRNVPRANDVVFLFEAGTMVTRSDSLDNYGLDSFGESTWCRELAASLLPFDEQYYLQSDNDYIVAGYRVGPEFADRVNRALSDHLLIDKGYRVAVDLRVLLDLNQFCHLSTPKTEHTVDYPVLVYMHLVDDKGRKLSFGDVGTGIAYVLPVLCAAYSKTPALQFIEQPELHLHPALQAALGDVFVEAMHQGSRLVIETHSEHVLLRILKRIRQTASDKPPLPELRLTPENVLVLYFDPQLDGTTRVRQLRISPDGDFLDSWPRGFFNERFQELFDE